MTSPTVVLVHGAWHAKWCWKNTIESLERSGITAIAVDLPGHETPGSSKRKWNTLSSYVDHVHSTIESVDGDVVLVGHSMGGLVVQRVLEKRTVKAAILVASIPRRGVSALLARLTRAHPDQVASTLSLSLWAFVANDDRVREQFFSPDTDALVVSEAGAQMQNESYPAFLSMLFRWPRPRAVLENGTPISVVAARHDTIFTLDEQHDLASTYGAELLVIDSAHDIMLEPAWPELVEHIAEVVNQ